MHTFNHITFYFLHCINVLIFQPAERVICVRLKIFQIQSFEYTSLSCSCVCVHACVCMYAYTDTFEQLTTHRACLFSQERKKFYKVYIITILSVTTAIILRNVYVNGSVYMKNVQVIRKLTRDYCTPLELNIPDQTL